MTPPTVARRPWLRSALLLAVTAGALLLGAQGRAQPARSELRIGYQKGASLFVLQKAQGSLEKRFAPLNVGVKWVEFPAGPQLLEARRRQGRGRQRAHQQRTARLHRQPARDTSGRTDLDVRGPQLRSG